MVDPSQVEVIVPENLAEPADVSMYRFKAKDNCIVMDFARQDEDAVRLVASVGLKPETIEGFVKALLIAMYKYETETGYSFGLFKGVKVNTSSRANQSGSEEKK